MDSYGKRLYRLAERVLPSSLPLFFKKARSLRSPCFYLGAAAVFLFIFVSFGSDLFLKSIADKNDFSLAALSKTTDLQVANKDSLLANQKLSPESPQFILVGDSALLASTPPTTFSPQVLGALTAGHEPEDVKKVITEYVVESGDTLSSLTAKFDISLNTILWANDLTRRSTLRIGQKLVIPPVSGVIHHVKSGDTLSEIARVYKGRIDEIVDFNNLSSESDIYIGDILVIPGGLMPAPSVKLRPAPINIPLADGQFILPVSSPYVITQGLHWYNAVDFSHPGYACGRPVFAVAGGTVQRIGYDSRFLGNHVRVLHRNGVVTLYGHLSGIAVETGEEVNVGAIIGHIGNTGYTKGPTGCHLHFEVRGARNPFVPER